MQYFINTSIASTVRVTMCIFIYLFLYIFTVAISRQMQGDYKSLV
jgi:hypothetical protein